MNRSYNLGSGTAGHEAVKESQVVFNDFLPLLNSVPPAPAVKLDLDQESGEYATPLIVTVTVDPSDTPVAVEPSRLTKQFPGRVHRRRRGETGRKRCSPRPEPDAGDTGHVAGPSFTAPGAAEDLTRTYWVGVRAIDATIVTDNTTPFDTSLLVSAATSDPTATLYYSLDGATWNVGATVTITSDAAVSFIAINPAASPPTS